MYKRFFRKWAFHQIRSDFLIKRVFHLLTGFRDQWVQQTFLDLIRIFMLGNQLDLQLSYESLKAIVQAVFLTEKK